MAITPPIIPAGLGVRTLIFAEAIPNAGWIAVDVSVINYAIGDAALIEFEKMFGQPPSFQTCGSIEIVNGNIVRVVGSPLHQDPAAPITAFLNPVISFIYYIDTIALINGYVTQTAGPIKSVQAGYNYQTELITTV